MKCVDSQLVAQVKAMLEDPAQLEQELKAVRELAALVELTLQQARGGGWWFRVLPSGSQCAVPDCRVGVGQGVG